MADEGKNGGITPIFSKDHLESKVNELYQLVIRGEPVREVYIEEMVDFEKEYYLSIVVDRNSKLPLLLASMEGGVNIEEVPKEKILSFTINPLIGLQTYVVSNVARFLHLDWESCSDLLHKLWSLFVEEQAQLVEINPLFITKNHEIIAGDAKVVLDENIERQDCPLLLERPKDNFEAKCESIGAAGVELDGDYALVTSGAGLGMATFDLVTHLGGKVKAVVDLQGSVIHDVAKAEQLIAEIDKLKPKAYLFNFYFQVASCKVLATAIANGLGNTKTPVIVRLKGNDEQDARQILSKCSNVVYTDQLDIACNYLNDINSGGDRHVHHH